MSLSATALKSLISLVQNTTKAQTIKTTERLSMKNYKHGHIFKVHRIHLHRLILLAVLTPSL